MRGVRFKPTFNFHGKSNFRATYLRIKSRFLLGKRAFPASNGRFDGIRTRFRVSFSELVTSWRARGDLNPGLQFNPPEHRRLGPGNGAAALSDLS